MLDAGADVHAQEDWALQWAAERGDEKIVKLLLSAGADVHAWDDGPLRAACWHDRPEVVKLLLAAGADVDAISEEDRGYKLLKDLQSWARV